MRVFYSTDYAAAGHSFDTTRKSSWIAASLVDEPLPGLELVAPALLGRSELEQVHAPTYLDALERGQPAVLASSCGFAWDEGLWRSARAHASGVVAAAEAALVDGVAGSLSSGLHHAHRDYGAGYCALNGLSLAASRLAGRGLKVLVVDLDAHCGGGTHEALVRLRAQGADVRQLDVVPFRNRFDDYHPQAGRLLAVRRAEEYLEVVAEALAAEAARPIDVVLYNAGVDVHDACRIGGMGGIDDAVVATRERLVFDWCRAQGRPVAFALAGGYAGGRMSQERLVALHRLTLHAAAVSV